MSCEYKCVAYAAKNLAATLSPLPFYTPCTESSSSAFGICEERAAWTYVYVCIIWAWVTEVFGLIRNFILKFCILVHMYACAHGYIHIYVYTCVFISSRVSYISLLLVFAQGLYGQKVRCKYFSFNGNGCLFTAGRIISKTSYFAILLK